MQDGALLDLPLSVAFCRRLRGDPVCLHDVSEVDEAVGKSLEYLAGIARQHATLRAQLAAATTEAARADVNSAISALAGQVDALCLDFTLPGHEHWKLRAAGDGGDAEEVTLDNLEEYLEATTRAMLVDSVAEQTHAFRAGFYSFAKPGSLRMFSPPEVALLFSDQRCTFAPWRQSDIEDAIVCSHGYALGDPQVRHLVACMATFGPSEQRLFMRFITGAPRLPVGGFKALRPRLQVVRAVPPAGHIADELFPTCMVCEVYLKLPAYSSAEILREKLLVAISEGQEHFAFD